MRWDHLFNDLAGQLEHELQSENDDLRLEEERLRRGRLALRARLATLMTAHGADLATVRVRIRSGEAHTLTLVTVGRDWVAGDLVDHPPGAQCIIPLAAVDALMLTPRQAEESLDDRGERSELAARLGIAFVLRDLCRRRATVTLQTDHGGATGTIDRVGRDHLDLAEHDQDVSRSASAVEHLRLIPFSQVLFVRL